MTYGLERGDLAAGNVVDVETALVDELTLGATVPDLWHTLVGPVLGLKEHDGGPVIGQVLNEAARGAGRSGYEVVSGGVHGQVERVAADDLMEMGRVSLARVDEGIDTVDDELGAGKAQHVLRCGSICQQGNGGEGSPMHLDGLFLVSLSRVCIPLLQPCS